MAVSLTATRLLEIGFQPWRHRHLIWALATRELSSRFRGSAFGGLWAVLQPVIMVAIFYYVLVVIFKARWAADSRSDSDFIVGIFTGLLIYGLFAETVARSSGAITGNVNYVKKIVFPITILPIVQLVFATVNMLIGFLVLLTFGAISGAIDFHMWTPSLLLVVIPVMLWAVGVGWYVSALNVYFRDTAIIVPLLLQGLMFLSPVFYSLDRVPEAARPFIMWSPLAIPIGEAQDILMNGEAVDLSVLVLPTLVGLVVTVTGYAFFRKVKPGFADVL